MTKESRVVAGWLLVIFPTVIFGGVTLLRFLTTDKAGYTDNALRQDLWRAGHAHAGVILVLSLIVLRYVDQARLSPGMKKLVRSGVPTAAILLPVAFFFSVFSPNATEPSGLIVLAYIGAVLLALSLVVVGVGLLRQREDAP